MRTVEVYRAANPLEAHLLQSALAEENIRSEIVGEFRQGGLGDLPVGWANPQIVVDSDDEAAAREIIAEWEARAAASASDDDELPADLAAEFGSEDESPSAGPRE